MLSSAPTAPATPLLRRPTFWLIALVLAAIGARAWLQFSTPLVPGMNGAYYLVQARSLLEHGHLGIPDLPLTFWLHAGLAKLLMLAAGLPQDDAILWAVKLADSALPPLAALPIAWLAFQWTRHGERPSAFICLAPAAAAALGSQVLSLTGNFQKNALALVWFAALAPAALVFLRRPSLLTMLAPLGLLALLGLTHIGVLGAAVVFCAVLAVLAIATAQPGARRHIVVLILLGTGVLGLAGGAAYAHYDPARVTRLLTAITQPATLSDDHGPGHPPGPPPGDRPAGASDFDATRPPPPPFAAGQHPPGPPPGPGGRHGWADPRTLVPALVCWFFALTSGWLLWQQRRRLPAAEWSVALAATLTTLVLAAPLYDGQKAERLLLIAIVPTAITAAFVFTRIVLLSWSRIVGTCALAALLLDSARMLPFGGRAVVSDATFAELATLKPLCPAPERTLIIARHGLEWWTAWVLHTHIAQPQAVAAEDWNTYAQVFYLQEKEPMGPPDFGPRQRADAAPSGNKSPEQENGTFPPPHGPGPELTLPADAVTLHRGATLTLSRLPNAIATHPEPPDQDPAF